MRGVFGGAIGAVLEGGMRGAIGGTIGAPRRRLEQALEPFALEVPRRDERRGDALQRGSG